MIMLTQSILFSICAAILLAIGLMGFLLTSDFLRKLLALNVIGMAIFMVLIAAASADPNAIDPIPHAMVLTGIVVAAAGTALGLNLASKIARFARSIQNENSTQQNKTVGSEKVRSEKHTPDGKGK
ncbi:MAG: multicomponent Na+:H+ antiporter subunit C [Gammaproteobacteria bacterium]|jgi:multicomponent Na+:H+ antiporter subunit C